MTRRDEVVADLKELARNIAEMQEKYAFLGPEWDALESVDDAVFNQLTKLGD